MRRGVIFVVSIVLLLPAAVAAQTWSADQAEVWATVTAQWEASSAKDSSWPERFLHPSHLGWSDTDPMPRNKAEFQEWDRYDSANQTTHVQDLSPVGIVVEGSTAVVHYYYSMAAEDREGKHKTTHGRWTDILVKQGGKWLFISWRGGRDPRLNE